MSVLIAALAACSGSPPPAPSNTAPTRERQAPPACTQDSLPELDLVAGNLHSTQMTGLAEIVASSKTDLDGKSPPPASGYVSLRYEVRVLRWFAGTGPETMRLTQGAEAEFLPHAPNKLLLFSACGSAPGLAHEPDVGYFFPFDEGCRERAQELGSAAAATPRPTDVVDACSN